MKGHEHEWTYLHPTKRVCESCPSVEVLTGAGDWVPVETTREGE